MFKTIYRASRSRGFDEPSGPVAVGRLQVCALRHCTAFARVQRPAGGAR